ncbi:hypothetical protein HYPSUDRAFT_40813 [Hypholoma sublateritium FD-334 SS-4]|uniref:Protein kinase domain-containing protein n=1 Tax=Hypholoma sublateritium (strain FD-334 SS-4) TaxID=945553 RepID=A0A0D2L6V3_HYPSF|nr:hypothetical protein HYPSUDRAFT_40813 [Hypholoma sublateritium FD-334 SS-4]
MGVAVSQILGSQEPDEAKKLGNPPIPLYFWKDAPDEVLDVYHGYTRVAHSITKGDREFYDRGGETIFQYNFDPMKFDGGNLIIVKYKYNWNKPDSLSLENKILHNDGFMLVEDFYKIIHPCIFPPQAHITSVVFSTRNGRHHITQHNTRDLFDLPYPPIPPAVLSSPLPQLLITELLSPKGFLGYHCCISVVLHEGELYAFKHHEIYPELVWNTVPPVDTLLIEMEHLLKVSTPNVLRATHIITDRSSEGRFRGFLQPFCPAGSLKNVLSSLHKTPPSSAWLTQWKRPSLKTTPFLISWTVKHKWCVQMTRALLDLHEQEMYIGRLTPGNFLIDKDGNIKLIDISPVTEYNLPYGAPERLKTRIEPDKHVKGLLTAERDIFSLGLIFWVLAEELVGFDRETRSVIPVITWTEKMGGAPPWFRSLVEDCIKRVPHRRPSARFILAILIMHLF